MQRKLIGNHGNDIISSINLNQPRISNHQAFMQTYPKVQDQSQMSPQIAHPKSKEEPKLVS